MSEFCDSMMRLLSLLLSWNVPDGSGLLGGAQLFEAGNGCQQRDGRGRHGKGRGEFGALGHARNESGGARHLDHAQVPRMRSGPG